MANTIKAFIAPHIEEKYALCQDRFYINTNKLFFSVSDGVSSSLFPTYYAKIISSYYDNNQVSLSKVDAERIFGLWKSYMDDLLQKDKLGRGTSQRYKRGETPSATYARLDVKKDMDNKWIWNVAVLGDCSILHLNIIDHGYKPIHVILSGKKFLSDGYKYQDEATYYKFGKLPDQLNSTGDFLENEALFTETLNTNDVFLLMTDGISDWLLGNQDKIEERIKLLLQLNSQLEFIQLVENERSNNIAGREMENDDISLVVLKFDDIQNDIIFEPKQMCVTDIDQRIEFEKEFKHRGIGFIRELEEKITEKEKKNTDLYSANQELQGKNKELEKKNTDLYSANQELQGKNKELEKKNTDLYSANQELQGKNKELEKKNTDLYSANQELQGKNKELEKKNTDLYSANQELQGKNKELEKKNKDLDSASQELQGGKCNNILQGQIIESETKSKETNSQNDSEHESAKVIGNDVPASNLENLDGTLGNEKKKTVLTKRYGVYILFFIIIVLQIFTISTVISAKDTLNSDYNKVIKVLQLKK